MIHDARWRLAATLATWVLWSLRQEAVDFGSPTSRWEPRETYATRESCEGARRAAATVLQDRPPPPVSEEGREAFTVVRLEDGVQVIARGERALVLTSRYQCFGQIFDPRR